MLEFDDPMGQCFSRFQTVSQKSRGREDKGKGENCIDKKSKSKYKGENLRHDHVLITVNIFSIKRK